MKKIMITGHLGRDPEGRHAPNGEWFVTFTVAVNVGTKTNPRTDWVDVSCNGKLTEIAQKYLKKGTRILVEGFPSTSAYINKEGKAVSTLRIAAKMLEILSSKDDSQGAKSNWTPPGDYATGGGTEDPEIGDNGEEIPFDNQF